MASSRSNQSKEHPTSLKDFQIMSKLGSGAFSKVFKVKRISDGKLYALKKVQMQNLNAKDRQNALNEVRILASFNHDPYIVSYKEAFFEESENCLCIVMEFCDGGDIFHLIEKCKKNHTFVKEMDIWKYFINIVHALSTLHSMNILHRDIKSANVFISNGNAKLGDLNVSKVAKQGLVNTQTGTPYYASPEVWNDKPYDTKSDIWSLGCVIYEIATLKPPFRAESLQNLFKKVLKGAYDPLPKLYSQELSQIISYCLKINPKERLTSKQLLNHPIVISIFLFITNFVFLRLKNKQNQCNNMDILILKLKNIIFQEQQNYLEILDIYKITYQKQSIMNQI